VFGIAGPLIQHPRHTTNPHPHVHDQINDRGGGKSWPMALVTISRSGPKEK
jgi:hypothetical protein